MSTDQERLVAFVDMLRSSVNDRCIEEGDGDSSVVPLGFREHAYTAVVLELLEELGNSSGSELCYFERRLGRGIAKVNAWSVDDEASQVDLYTTIFRDLAAGSAVPAGEITTAIRRAAFVYAQAQTGIHAQMEPALPEHDMMQRLHEVSPTVSRLQVIVIVDGIAADVGKIDFEARGLQLTVQVWDHQRLFRAHASGVPYESTEIDIREHLGMGLPCLPMPESSADYQCYLSIVPGRLLHALYHAHGARLLELNVRSFLQARGKVNRGIRETLKQQPARFLAYNNGISATAESVEVEASEDGTPTIVRIRGLQIVNGGQTVASIHRAREKDRADLSDVFVQAKLTIVRPEHIESLVPLVSRYANTQNRVNEADFSANHPFHVRLQQLSDTVWTPGEQSRWFYERARGQYQVARAREGTTPARLRRFDAAIPSRQRFDKVELARYLNSWAELPHQVSRGGQKNFIHLMERLSRSHGEGWEPDPSYYRRLIAQAIVFKAAEAAARKHRFPGYRANAVAYTVALLSYRTAGRLDLEAIWNAQSVSPAVAETLYDWMRPVYEGILETAGSRNVTEWCKREECWRQLQTLPVALPEQLEQELAEGQPLPNVGESAGQSGPDLTSEDRENIARVMKVTAEEWIRISGWGATNNTLQAWQIGIASTLAGYAAGGWAKVPSRRQALQATQILRLFQAGDHPTTSAESI